LLRLLFLKLNILYSDINSYSIVDMELCSDVINGLKLVADTSKIPDKYFILLLNNTTNSLVESKRFEPLQGTLYLFVKVVAVGVSGLT